ncbi:MAG: sigma-54-dependent Fis family transcriptional regulator [FCB group bacterium]|nr:sigma-54-dependent Fis family transcriptional regulator [FCB group bacterium]
MKQNRPKILVIDDDPKIKWLLSEGLSNSFDFIAATSGSEGLQMVGIEKPSLILLDIKMPEMSGIEVLKRLGKVDVRPEVIMLSGHDETRYVVESMKNGAAEFIKKPFDLKEVEIHINSVLEKSNLKREVTILKSELRAKSQYDSFVGDSPKIVQVKNLIEQVANSELTVLIRGESGTGKEIIARMIHNVSDRGDESFTKVNCAAIPRDLLEAELFGYEKGAFTGAHKTKPGRFEVANKGTIFLDEIGDMPLELQSKLLQVLEQQEFVRVGGITNIHVDVRIICATNRNLEDAISQKLFRDDLFYRLNEITVFLPPLRDRVEDVPLLVNHFVEKYNKLYERKMAPLSENVLEKLMSVVWPGNVRQLENLIKQVVVRGDESVAIDLLVGQSSSAPVPTDPAAVTGVTGSAPEAITNEPPSFSLKKLVSETVSREEKALISKVLNRTNWNRRKAAEILEISYRSLLYKIKEYGLNEIK